MQYDDLARDLDNSSSVRLIRSQSAPLILAYLHQVFKRPGRLVVGHGEMLDSLDHMLEALREENPKACPSPAAIYLRQWCDEEHRFLRRYHEPGKDEAVYELTADSERALNWVQDLYKQEFVGAESRFLHIFTLLREIVEMSTTDPQARLAQLQVRQAEVQSEIDAILATGQVTALTATQVKERFAEATQTARRLVADFREVEENFRAIARAVQTQQLGIGLSKGQIVGYVLDADAALKESDQGRSFYAFWQFLVSPRRQEELQTLLEQVYDQIDAMPDLPVGDEASMLLRQLKRRLLDASIRIVESNRRLAEQLRKLLDEQRAGEARRVQEMVAAIKHLASQVDPQAVDAALASQPFVCIDGDTAVNLPMERQLWRPVQKTVFAAASPEWGAGELGLEALGRVLALPAVNSDRLRRNIDIVLSRRGPASLPDMLASFPLRYGLSEIVTYLAIAAHDVQHLWLSEVRDTLVWHDDGQEYRVQVPHIVFGGGQAQPVGASQRRTSNDNEN